MQRLGDSPVIRADSETLKIRPSLEIVVILEGNPFDRSFICRFYSAHVIF